MKRNWTGIVAGYLLLAILGTSAVLVGTAYARAWIVGRAIGRSERMLQGGRPGAALAHLDRIKNWSVAYAALEKRRLCLAVRCHVMRMDLRHAQASAEDAIDADTGALVSRETGALDYMLTSLVELSWLDRDPGAALSPWSGYAVLIRELRRTGQGHTVDIVLRDAASRFPDGRLPADVRAELDGLPTFAAAPHAPPARAPSRTPTPAASVHAPGPAASMHALLAGGATPPEPAADAATADTRAEAAAATDVKTDPPTPTPPTAADEPPGGASWGVVKVPEGHAYEVNGKFRKSLPAGTLLDVRDVRDTAAGRLAICRLTDAVGPSILVPCNELDLRPGRYSDANPAERRLRSRRAVVAARIEKARQAASPATAAEDGLADANPHAAAFRKASDEVDTFQRRAQQVQAKWEKATGGERMKYADELREMKAEQVRLEAACQQARQKAEEWAAAHPAPAPAAEPPTAPAAPQETTRDEVELAEIDKQLEML